MGIQPLAIDTLASACCVKVKLRGEMLMGVPANIRQELLLALLIAPQPVALELMQKVMKATPKVVQVVSHPQNHNLLSLHRHQLRLNCCRQSRNPPLRLEASSHK